MSGLGHLAIDVSCPKCGSARDVECTGDLSDAVQLGTVRRFHRERVRAAALATRTDNEERRRK